MDADAVTQMGSCVGGIPPSRTALADSLPLGAGYTAVPVAANGDKSPLIKKDRIPWHVASTK